MYEAVLALKQYHALFPFLRLLLAIGEEVVKSVSLTNVLTHLPDDLRAKLEGAKNGRD